jgi:2-phospho-L-lactate transferase/gluconeogenesis factor (CofD/UPF0052 family)
MPHLLVPRLAAAMVRTKAHRVLNLNLTATADETDGYTASRHLEALLAHAPDLRFETIVVDPSFAAADPALPTSAARLGADLRMADVRADDGSPQHDPAKLAKVLGAIMGL